MTSEALSGEISDAVRLQELLDVLARTDVAWFRVHYRDDLPDWRYVFREDNASVECGYELCRYLLDTTDMVFEG